MERHIITMLPRMLHNGTHRRDLKVTQVPPPLQWRHPQLRNGPSQPLPPQYLRPRRKNLPRGLENLLRLEDRKGLELNHLHVRPSFFFMVFTSLHNSLKMHPTHLSFSDARKKSAGLLKYPTGTPASAVPKSKGSTVPSLPNGWSSAVDPGSGKEYFFSSDGQTSWERPTAPP